MQKNNNTQMLCSAIKQHLVDELTKGLHRQIESNPLADCVKSVLQLNCQRLLNKYLYQNII